MKKKKEIWILLLFVIEIVFLLLSCAKTMRGQRANTINYLSDEFIVAQDSEGDCEIIEGNSINNSHTGINRRIVSPSFTLNKGIYQVTVSYQTNTSAGSQIGSYSKITDDGEYSWLESEEVRLTNKGQSEQFRVYIKKNNTDVKFKTIMDDGCENTIQIDQVTITYLNGRSLITDILKWLLGFAAVNVIFYLFVIKKDSFLIWLNTNDNGVVLLGLLVTLFIAELPMTMNYIPKGYDLRFHYYRVYSIAQGLADGIFPVKVQPEWLNGYGYPTGVFYGDILLYLPAVLYAIGFSLATAYKVYVLFINAITILISYYCFRKISKNNYIGLMGCAAYTLSLHRLVATYTRAAVGAYSAMVFLPLVILGLWAIYYADEKEYKKGWFYLMVGATGILETQILGTVMTAMFAVVFMLVSYKKTFTKRTLMALLKTAVGSILLNLYFLVPFLDMYGSMKLRVGEEHRLIYYFSAFVSQLFSTAYNAAGDVREDLSGMYYDMPMSLGPVAGVIIIAALVYLFISKKKYGKKIIITLLLFITGSIWMATNLFPYKWLLADAPFIYSFIEKFEFAWRFLAISTILIVSLFVALLVNAQKEFSKKCVMLMGGIICAFYCYQGADYLFKYNNTMIPFEYEKSFDELTVGAVYDGQYLPEGFDENIVNLYPGITVSDSETVLVDIIERRQLSYHVVVKNLLQKDAYIELPLLNYKGYSAVSGKEKLLLSSGDNFRVRVALPEEFEGEIKVFYQEPWYWRLAEIISLITMILFIGYVYKEHRNGESEK